MPQVGGIGPHDLYREYRGFVCSGALSGVSTEWRRDHSILAGRTIGFLPSLHVPSVKTKAQTKVVTRFLDLHQNCLQLGDGDTEAIG